jgi:hypothetical protein
MKPTKKSLKILKGVIRIRKSTREQKTEWPKEKVQTTIYFPVHRGLSRFLFYGVHVAQSFVFWVVARSLFVLFLLAILFSVLLFEEKFEDIKVVIISL